MKIYKIKIEKVSLLRNWGKQLQNELKNEAIDTLREENCTRELFVIFEDAGQWYLVAHMEGGPFNSSTDREINRIHKQIMHETIDRVMESEVLYDVSVM